MDGEINFGEYKLESNQNLSLTQVYQKWSGVLDDFDWNTNMEMTPGIALNIVNLGLAYAELMSAIHNHLKNVGENERP